MRPKPATILGDDGKPKIHRHYLVLRGGYVEQRHDRDRRTTTTRWLGPGRVNVLMPGVFHRVELREDRPAWTLFVHGRTTRRWGFLDSVTGAFRLWSPSERRAP